MTVFRPCEKYFILYFFNTTENEKASLRREALDNLTEAPLVLTYLLLNSTQTKKKGQNTHTQNTFKIELG